MQEALGVITWQAQELHLLRLMVAKLKVQRKRPATTILTVKAGLVQRLPVHSFQRCGSSSSTRLAG
jgi:hypothetical protein